MLTDYIIAIPSYKRHDILKKKTLKVLADYKIAKSRIYIFVANIEEYKLYDETLDKNTYNKIIIGKKGIKEIRNFMAKYFDEGQYIVYMDDDIGKLWECVNDVTPYDKKHNKVIKLKSFHSFIEKAFKLSKNTGYHNWGVYPRDNPYFMKPTSSLSIPKFVSSVKSKSKSKSKSQDLAKKSKKSKKSSKPFHISTDLKFLIGFLTGVINNRKAEIRTIGDKEDYERTIKYYLNDGGVIRFNNISCYTRCYKVPGGIQADRKIGLSKKNADILIKRYPDLVSINNGRKSPFVEIKLKDKR